MAHLIVKSRVIIIENKKVLLIRRYKNGNHYYTLPGGMVEKGETIKNAAIREIKEETNLDIVLGKKIFRSNTKKQSHRHYFLVKSFKGDLKLGGPEIKRQSANNQYFLEWVKIEKLDKIDLLPIAIKKIIKERVFK